MSHTPAPWHIVRYAVSSYHIVTDGDKGPIASVPTDHPGASANARLIAASPDLLEAIRELQAVAETAEWWHDPSHDWYPVRFLVQDAVDKAEGRLND